jgi:hypothetical protein
MGGNALAPFGARRYNRDEYLVTSKKALNLLSEIVPGSVAVEIPSYHSKESFGDLDVLTLPLTAGHYEAIKLAFKGPFVHNSEVMSIMLEELQVDIIPMAQENFLPSLMYYSYNDLGNLMGKIYHKFGLKYGHRGLTMPMKDGDNQYEEIVVSRDGVDIFNFLGLNYQRFKSGFSTIEDVYKFVIGSKYFSPVPFQYENLNHTNRIRDRKRATYHGFLEYIKDMPEGYKFRENKSEYLPLIFDHFPHVKALFDEGLKKLEHRIQVRQRFNGRMVGEWTGFQGEELGGFMAHFKGLKGEFAKWVLDFTREQLEQMVKDEAFKWVRDNKSCLNH